MQKFSFDAKRWDKVQPSSCFNGYQLSRMMSLDKATNILQIGCGTGLETQIIIEFANKTAQITAADLDEEILELCKQRISALKNVENQINFKVENVCSLSFQDQTFDRILASCVIHLTGSAESAKVAAQQIFRILQNGGIAGFCQFGDLKNSTIFSLSVKAFDETYEETKDETIVPFQNQYPYVWCYKHDWKSLFKEVGFTKILSWKGSVQFLDLDPNEIGKFILNSKIQEKVMEQPWAELFFSKMRKLIEAELQYRPLFLDTEYFLCFK